MRTLVVVAVVAGCGRIGFGPLLGDAGGDGDGGDGDAGDGGDDATTLVPWSVVQTSEALGGPIPLAATGSGNLIVVVEQLRDSDAITSITDNAPGGSNTYVAIPAADAIEAGASTGIEIWYATGSRPGATSIVVASSLPTNATVVWEVSGPPTFVLDDASALSDQPKTATPSGPMVNTTAPGDFIVSAAIVRNAVLGISAGNEFTNDRTTNANGWAHISSTSAPAGPHQAQWDQNIPGEYCASAAAFRGGL